MNPCIIDSQQISLHNQANTIKQNGKQKKDIVIFSLLFSSRHWFFPSSLSTNFEHRSSNRCHPFLHRCARFCEQYNGTASIASVDFKTELFVVFVFWNEFNFTAIQLDLTVHFLKLLISKQTLVDRYPATGVINATQVHTSHMKIGHMVAYINVTLGVL